MTATASSAVALGLSSTGGRRGGGRYGHHHALYPPRSERPRPTARVPHPCQNKRQTAVIGSHSQTSKMASDLCFTRSK
jgi:hypothetical protein